MGGRRLLIAFTLSSVAVAAACANILGIDDGVPRDASVDAITVDVGGGDVQTDAMVEEDSGPFSPISCGTTTCNFARGEACCHTGTSTYDCVDAASACKNGMYIPCDRPEQCPSGEAGPKQCCTTDVLTDAGTYIATSVGCLTEAQCQPIPTHYILCGDDAGKDCPDATSCGDSVTTLPTFLICK